MYLAESERLATKHPDLARLVEALDRTLHDLDPAAAIRPADLARHLNADQNQTQSVLDLLAEAGVLRTEECVECGNDNCHTLHPLDDYNAALAREDDPACTLCGEPIKDTPGRRLTIYRQIPTARPITRPTANKASPETPEGSFDQDLSPEFTNDPFRSTPLLNYYSRDPTLEGVQPFAGKRIILILHFLRDLLPFIEAAKRLGLDPARTTAYYKKYPYPQKNAIASWLQREGVTVAPRSGVSAHLKELGAPSSDPDEKLLVIEDGGFIAPAIQTSYKSLASRTLGVVEQTTRGIMNIREALGSSQPLMPVLSVATSALKGRFEPPYIARAVVANIQRLLPALALNGKRIAVLGYGTIGKELAGHLRANSAVVEVFDQNSDRRLEAHQNGFTISDSAAAAAAKKNLVIGCSGRTSVDASVIANLDHGSQLVSASSEQYELAINELKQQARSERDYRNDDGDIIGTTFVLPPADRQIHVLANGYPINFWGMNSMPEEASDLVMTLLLLAAAEVARGTYPERTINDQAINELADEEHYNVAGKFLEFHKQG